MDGSKTHNEQEEKGGNKKKWSWSFPHLSLPSTFPQENSVSDRPSRWNL